MTYGIKMSGTWRTPYWKSNISNSEHYNKNTNEYMDLNEALFKTILMDELDVPDCSELTSENIKQEFGLSENSKDISDECMEQILNYYKWRKMLFDKICNLTLNNNAEFMLAKFGCDEIKIKYNIPAECNNYSCDEPNYTGGQTEAYLEIGIYK